MTWPELVSNALLGTARREPAALAPLEVVRDSPEEQLLARAAVTAVYRRAGALPRAGLRPLEPAPPETLPLCSLGAALRLATILSGEFAPVLDEWLALARARGARVPEELLPDLLAAGRGREDAVLAVAGERGRWLARFDERWSWAAAGDDTWETGSLEARRTWLRQRRASDPAAARAALEQTWTQEDPRTRAALLAELAAGLSHDDEDLLERAQQDRRLEVRAAAADLLARLPRSRFAQGMAERARPLLRAGRRRLEAQLPDEPSTKDIPKPPRGTGERAWWLQQLLAATPLRLWEHELDRTPAELARLPVADNLAGAVHAGWAAAAARQRAPEWAAALLPLTWDPSLIAAIPPEVAEDHIRAALDDDRAPPGAGRASSSDALDDRCRAALDALRRPWGFELSLALVRRGALDRGSALALDPHVLDHLPDDAPPGVVRTLAFRHELHKELA